MMRELDDMPLARIDGSTTTRGSYRGKVLRLYEARNPGGLEILDPAQSQTAGIPAFAYRADP